MKKKKNTKLFEWQERAKQGTEKCRCGETRHLNVDHIVPVALLKQFGLDDYQTMYEMEENFELLCRYCNLKKRDGIDVRNPKTYLILRKLLNESEDYFINNKTI